MGFETVVRPVVFPNIRPQGARALRIEDAPDKGLAVITGGSNKVIDLSSSEQESWTKHRTVEVKRIYDKARIYYTNPDGTFDYDVYWEFEVLTRIEFYLNGSLVPETQSFQPMPKLDNVKIISKGHVRKAER